MDAACAYGEIFGGLAEACGAIMGGYPESGGYG